MLYDSVNFFPKPLLSPHLQVRNININILIFREAFNLLLSGTKEFVHVYLKLPTHTYTHYIHARVLLKAFLNVLNFYNIRRG